MRRIVKPTSNSPSNCLGDARLKVTATATGGTVLIPDPEVTTFRPCSMMDDFVIIGELLLVFVSHLLLFCLLYTFISLSLLVFSIFFILFSIYVCLHLYFSLHNVIYLFFAFSLLLHLFSTLSLLQPHLPLSSTTATDGLWDVMTSQAAVDYVTDDLIRAGILPPRSEQSDDYTFQDRSTPTRGLVIFIIL